MQGTTVPHPPAAAPAPVAPANPGDPSTPSGPVVFFARRQFIWKTIVLALTTVALIPVLLYKDVMAAQIYLVILIAVHILGGIVIFVGVRRHQIAPDRRGLIMRLIGLVALVALLALAAKGLTTEVSDWLFWGALFAIWALHTLGLALLHLRSRREQSVCPFV